MTTPAKPDMEAYRLAKKITCLAKAEGRALLAITDACSMRDGECRKSLATLAKEHKDSVRQLKYGIHGRLRTDGTEYYPGLLRRGIIAIKSSGDGIPTSYVTNLDALKALVYGAETSAQSSAQTDAQTRAQNEADQCTNECEPVHIGAGTSALMHPSSSEVPKGSSSNQPSFPGGAAELVDGGNASAGQGAGNDDSPLTESLMLDAIQRAHSETRNEWNDRRMGSYESVPVVPNLAKSKELFDELWRRGIRTVNQLPVVRAAYKNWFEAVYLASFDEAANDATTVRQPIRYALAVFRKEAGLFLDQAREEMQDGLEPEEAA
jgi:hypothetical protein